MQRDFSLLRNVTKIFQDFKIWPVIVNNIHEGAKTTSTVCNSITCRKHLLEVEFGMLNLWCCFYSLTDIDMGHLVNNCYLY